MLTIARKTEITAKRFTIVIVTLRNGRLRWDEEEGTVLN
jgi:hypothetical protein